MHLYLAIQTARNKFGEQINCLRSLKSKICCRSKKRTRSKRPCKEARIRAHRLVYGGVREKIRRKGIFSLEGIPLGYA